VSLSPACRHGYFVAPTLIEIDRPQDLEREIFGPVLHVLRYRRDQLDTLIDGINGTGYGLTFGVHTRLDETVAHVTSRIHAGNMYVNRNIVGAVVGVQPFGGEGLSGTGPKAGGPLYLYRLLSARPQGLPAGIELTKTAGHPYTRTMPGPTGESNTYQLLPRGTVLCVAATNTGAQAQFAAASSTGNRCLFVNTPVAREWLSRMPPPQAERVSFVADADIDQANYDAVLFEGDGDALRELNLRLALRDGPILSAQGFTSDALASGAAYALDRLLTERSLSVNTAAAGGNASLMTIG
jgi:RHH-type proline utilization regulon transcriptional repressor/proline dehydrogenase/delta 1-pyrroline-5-carboxylate dehydrogenase